MTSLGVNENHQTQVVNYMRFARYQRGLRLRAVDACFKELKDSRLIEETYTIDEVTDMLDGLLAVVRGEVESELINTAHTNVLLMRQVFQQAEKWHLKMQADISELENRELLEKIKDFEDQEFSGTKRDSDFSFMKSKLEPLNEGGGAALLHMRIEELDAENEALRNRLRAIEGESFDLKSERSRLAGDLEKTRGELGKAQQKDSDIDVNEIRRRMAGLQTELEITKKSGAETEASIHGDLVAAKHELLKIQEMLEMAQQELEKKVHQTNIVKNMKQMLQKKNEQLKELRKRLSKYESLSDD
ncbi:leucine zipper transcription factor-like protein 1 [Liolophura sinensis]|uniref:leucine zipper transcription factor-like protein 1 n=1 Tax=Liolophura sinensis TaxID=3198878 RepID=UPI003158254F